MNVLVKGAAAVSLALVSSAVLASPYANENKFAINGKDMHVSETSARILSNPEGSAPLLVEDITDGLGKKTPGYKVMVMTRAISIAYNARQKDDGTIEALKTVHRGGKVLFGIPVKNGQMQLNDAKVLSLGLISDDGKTFTINNKDTRPSGEQKFDKIGSQVSNLSYKINSLTFPNLASGERVGGGINYRLSVVVDGAKYDISANTNFPIVETKGQPKHLKAFPVQANTFGANR